MLRLAVASASKDARAWHPYGTSDPEGFVAMGIVEVLVHTHDIARGLDIDWAPPEELCRPVLLRLFPDAAQGHPSESSFGARVGRHSATAHVSRLGAGTLPSADRQEPGTPASAADGVRHRLHPVQLRPAARTDRPKSDCQRRRSLAAYEG